MNFYTYPEVKELIVLWDHQIYVSDAKEKVWKLTNDLRKQGLRICDVNFSHPLRLINGEIIDNRLTNKMKLTLKESWDITPDIEHESMQKILDFLRYKVVPDPVEDFDELIFPK